MSFDFFPNKMNSVRSSNHQTFLKFFRIGSLAVCGVIAVLAYLAGLLGFRSMSPWLILFPLIFEILAVVTEFAHTTALDRAASVVYTIAWPITTIFALFFFEICYSLGALNFNTLVIFVPWLLLLVDFLLNQISYIRLQYIFPIAITAFFIFYLLEDVALFLFFMPSTTALIIQLAAVVAVVVLLELSRLIKVRSCSESDVEKSLI